MSPTGTYNSGPLVPGEYLVRVVAPGFKTVELPATVQVGNITTSSVTLEVGATTTVITVEGAAITLNTEQSTIQGVVTEATDREFAHQRPQFPGPRSARTRRANPRRRQLRSHEKGLSSISFGGRFGRTARIEVDGLDISDETVGTTTQNIPINSIKEFQVSQSSLDLATELTSSGTSTSPHDPAPMKCTDRASSTIVATQRRPRSATHRPYSIAAVRREPRRGVQEGQALLLWCVRAHKAGSPFQCNV